LSDRTFTPSRGAKRFAIIAGVPGLLVLAFSPFADPSEFALNAATWSLYWLLMFLTASPRMSLSGEGVRGDSILNNYFIPWSCVEGVRSNEMIVIDTRDGRSIVLVAVQRARITFFTGRESVVDRVEREVRKAWGESKAADRNQVVRKKSIFLAPRTIVCGYVPIAISVAVNILVH
jgi:hypothetical protein